MCFFSEADAEKLGNEAGREASRLYRTHPDAAAIAECYRKSAFEASLQRIRNTVDPTEIKKAIKMNNNRVYASAYAQSWKKALHMGVNEAKHFSIVEFYGCLKCLVSFLLS